MKRIIASLLLVVVLITGVVGSLTGCIKPNKGNDVAADFVMPEGGFDTTAKRIARFSEVTDLALVSGSCDLLVTVRGNSLQEVAAFISEKLATIDGVISTATTFQLKQYKVSGKLLENSETVERLAVCP